MVTIVQSCVEWGQKFRREEERDRANSRVVGAAKVFNDGGEVRNSKG